MREERDDDRAARHRGDDSDVDGDLVPRPLLDGEVSRRVIMSA